MPAKASSVDSIESKSSFGRGLNRRSRVNLREENRTKHQLQVTAFQLNEHLMQSNLRTLARKNIIGLELLIAEALPNQIESSFGHSLIRLIDDDSNPYNDLVISFVAEVPPRISSAILDELDHIRRGLTGGYPSTLNVLTFAQFLSEYSKSQGRSFKRYPLVASEESLANLVNDLNTYGRDLKSRRYRFIDQNCATILLSFLRQTGDLLEPRVLMRSIAPTSIPRYLEHSIVRFSPGILIRSSFWYLDKVAKVLKRDLIDLLQGHFDHTVYDYMVLNFPPEVIAQIYLDAPIKDHQVRRKLIAFLQEKGKTIDLISQLRSFSPNYYRLCETRECADVVLQEAEVHFGKQGLIEIGDRLARIISQEQLDRFFDDELSSIQLKLRLSQNQNRYLNNWFILQKTLLDSKLFR